MKANSPNCTASRLPVAQQTLMTADDLWKLPDDEHRYELVKGELRQMPPAGSEHGVRAVRITWRLAQYVEMNKLGCVFAAETGFKIAQNPDTVRAPDVAFVRQSSIPENGIPAGYWEGAPDLAVEVISPGDTYTAVAEKVDQWLQAGCSLVWVVNPRRRTVEVYRAPDDFTILKAEDILDGEAVVEGFQCRVAELFE
ncbi:MAG: Uma2 family endonuclease [Candidatus Poribacteria bacterium]|nr:Uma2 family endonuclease [Candidatus Poribacteria bacterium]